MLFRSAPGEYTVVLASGLNVKKNYVHTNFRLSASGDVLALFDASGELQEKLIIEPVQRGVSVGRAMDRQGVFYFKSPTPGAANSSPSQGIVSMPVTSISGGSYEASQQVALSSATEGAEIYYTTDGTVPTQDSHRYSSPIDVTKTGLIRAREIGRASCWERV